MAVTSTSAGEMRPEADPPLSEEQQAIVDDEICGTKLVMACAGSGKTKVLTKRIGKFLATGQCEPENCLVVTFTNNAATEIARRLEALRPGSTANMLIGTFHSVALKTLSAAHAIDPLHVYFVDELQFMLEAFLLDDCQYAQAFRRRIKHMFVDEFQDVNDPQYRLMRLMRPTLLSLTGVGDDDQNLYQFRGSSVEYIRSFCVDFPGTRVFHLSTNYRSTPEIVALANASIAHNKRVLVKPPGRAALPPSGILPRLMEHGTSFASVRAVCQDIAQLLRGGGGSSSSTGRPLPSDIAVLCRNNYLLNHVQATLCKMGIRSVFYSGDDRFSRSLASADCAQCVVLTTVHSSKGLEWLHVYIIGMSQSHFPNSREPDVEQERRLYYVALTRCKRHLTLCNSFVDPSLFVCEVPRSLMAPTTAHGAIGSSLAFYPPGAAQRMSVGAAPETSVAPEGKIGVLSTLRGLQGQDYYHDLRTLPALDIESFSASLVDPAVSRAHAAGKHPHAKYAKWIASNFLEKEFGNYLDYLFRRMVAELTGAAACVDRYAEQCLASSSPSPPAAGSSCYAWKMLAPEHRELLAAGYAAFVDTKRVRWRDCLRSVWLASIFASLRNSKTYVLYVRVTERKLACYAAVYERMWAFVERTCRHQSPIHTSLPVAYEGLVGELDMQAGGLIVDFKNSLFDLGRCQIDHFLQVLAYAAIVRKSAGDKNAVTKVGLYNALGNVYHEVDLSGWTGDDELLAFFRRRGKSPI